MAARICASCLYNVKKEMDQRSQHYSDCRESPPTVVVAAFKDGVDSMRGQKVGKIMTVWPRVQDSDWCGKWARKEQIDAESGKAAA